MKGRNPYPMSFLIHSYRQFRSCVGDMLGAPVVQSMNQYIQHGSITTLEHSVTVAFISFMVCKTLRLNFYAAARGGLLHDLFLYDWHDAEHRGKLHGYYHPAKALENAKKHFALSDIEQDIIKKHMWPVTIKFPRYYESFVVSCADKLCAIAETFGISNRVWFRRALAVERLAKHIPLPVSQNDDAAVAAIATASN